MYDLVWTLGNIVFRVGYGCDVHGADKIPTDTGCLIVSNHASFFDPPLIGSMVQPRLCFLARKTLFTGRWGALLRSIQAHPIDRDAADLAGLRNVIRLLKEGNRVVLFPEGTRTPDGNLLDSQPGAGFIAGKAGVPIMPARLFGTFEAWPRDRKLPRVPMTVPRLAVVFGDPFDPPAKLHSKEDYAALSQRMMDEVGKIEKPE